MAVPTLNALSLGNVQTIAYNKDANIISIPFPGQNSGATDLYDALGITKIINIVGNFTGTTTAAVKALVDAIDALADGDQSSTVSFVSDELGTLNVMVASFDVTWQIPSNRVDYTIKLIQGTAVT